MKYKVLLTGNNRVLMNEIFTHMDYNLECMSSTYRSDDMMCHLKYFKPDGVVFCLQNEGKYELSGFRGVAQKLSAQNIPLIMVGGDEECDEFGKVLPMASDVTIRKPYTTKGLEEKILSCLNEWAEKRKKEKQKEEFLKKSGGSVSEEGTKTPSGEDQDIMDTLAFIEKLAGEIDDKPVEKKHILVVDDDSSVLKLVKGYLGNQYNVATAISGKVAMKFLEKKETDLILLDYEMPEENGAQVLKKIRSNGKTKNLPVVFLTGVTDRERIQNVLELNPQGYLLKPLDVERLSATLKDILGS